MTRGSCVTDQDVTQLAAARCGAPEAAFRIVARVAAQRDCPARTQIAIAPRALPRRAVACLRRI